MAKRSSNHPLRKSRSNGFFGFVRRTPVWFMWAIGGFVATIYVSLFYHFFIGSLSIRWQALYGSVPEPDAERYPIRGIDISHYQSQIDWKKLNEASIRSNLIRFIFIKATEGATIVDKSFSSNFDQARDNGYIRGAYHYFKAQVDAAKQAQNYIDHVNLQRGDLAPVLDVEEIGGLDKMQLQRAVRCWLSVIEAYYGVKPIIYTSFKFKSNYLDDPYFDAYPYWIAHYYRSELNYEGEWAFWQYNDCGVVDGINGSVDFDVFNGDIKRLRTFTIPDFHDQSYYDEEVNLDTLMTIEVDEDEEEIEEPIE